MVIGVSDDELMARALRAYWTAARKAGLDALIPGTSSSGVQELNKKLYAVLQNVDRILAVYRLRNDGVLKRLKRWPKALEPLPGSSVWTESQTPREKAKKRPAAKGE